MRLVFQALMAGIVVALLTAGGGWAMVRDSEVGSSEAQLGATMLLGAPGFGGATSIVSGVIGFLLGRSARRRRPARRSAQRLIPAIEPISSPRVSAGQHQLIAMYRVKPGTIDQVARQ